MSKIIEAGTSTQWSVWTHWWAWPDGSRGNLQDVRDVEQAGGLELGVATTDHGVETSTGDLFHWGKKEKSAVWFSSKQISDNFVLFLNTIESFSKSEVLAESALMTSLHLWRVSGGNPEGCPLPHRGEGPASAWPCKSLKEAWPLGQQNPCNTYLSCSDILATFSHIPEGLLLIISKAALSRKENLTQSTGI